MSKARVSAQTPVSSFGALEEEFLLHRYLAASQAENIRRRGLRILYLRMERMSDFTLLKAIREFSESGAPDMAAITGVAMPGENLTSILQELGLTTSNPYKDAGLLLEATELAAQYLTKNKAHLQTKEGG
jgi:hypothetical protein